MKMEVVVWVENCRGRLNVGIDEGSWGSGDQ